MHPSIVFRDYSQILVRRGLRKLRSKNRAVLLSILFVVLFNGRELREKTITCSCDIQICLIPKFCSNLFKASLHTSPLSCQQVVPHRINIGHIGHLATWYIFTVRYLDRNPCFKLYCQRNRTIVGTGTEAQCTEYDRIIKFTSVRVESYRCDEAVTPSCLSDVSVLADIHL